MLSLNNSYLTLPEKFYRKVRPALFPKPKVLAFNQELASKIGLDFEGLSDFALARFFSGQNLPDNISPIALAYAGFQFGHPVYQLGDGRAHLLGEISGYDIQLKGSGPTPFSRSGDGKSALGPVLREYIMSEAMHHLGVPTTRALCAVQTGENILRREAYEPGGVFTRVAPSHIRVGSFQYFSFRQDFEAVETLLNYTIQRHYPEFKALPKEQKALELLKSLTRMQANLVAKWSAFGFIHGVMNTDNFSLAGVTIDYGPCAFMEEFSFNKVFSSIDTQGRYAFFNQVSIAKWNILRFAESLLPLIHSDSDKAVQRIEKEVLPLFEIFDKERMRAFARKIGIENYQKEDEKLIMQFLELIEKESLDFTLSFYHLPNLHKGNNFFYGESSELLDFSEKWKKRTPVLKDLSKVNPLYIPRNHLVERAIHLAYQGDLSYFHRLNKALRHPYENKSKDLEFSVPAKPQERVYKTYCGT